MPAANNVPFIGVKYILSYPSDGIRRPGTARSSTFYIAKQLSTPISHALIIYMRPMYAFTRSYEMR